MLEHFDALPADRAAGAGGRGALLARAAVESEEPRMIAFNSYASEDGTDVSTVQVHPDSESLDIHLKLFAKRLSALLRPQPM